MDSWYRSGKHARRLHCIAQATHNVDEGCNAHSSTVRRQSLEPRSVLTPLGKLFRMTQFKDKAVDTSKDHAKRTSAAESNACLGESMPVMQHTTYNLHQWVGRRERSYRKTLSSSDALA